MEVHASELPHELLVAVLNRLGSRPLAAAACVCISWRRASSAVNSTPRFVSALSSLPQVEEAMDEVLREVLQAPFWPDFAIIFAGSQFKLSDVSALVKKRLPPKMALIACNSAGIAGRDVTTGENIEMVFEQDEDIRHVGLVIAVGRFPGVHVKALKLNNSLSLQEVEQFVDAASTAPYGGQAPVTPFAILLMGDPKPHPSIFLEALEKAFGGKSILVGGLATTAEDIDAGPLLAHSTHSTISKTAKAPCEEENSSVKAGNIRRSRRVAEEDAVRLSENDDLNLDEKYTRDDYVALVFTEDTDDSRFNEISMERVLCKVAGAGGLKAVGPVYKVVSVKDSTDLIPEGWSTQISCEREGMLMDGFAVLEDIDTEIHGVGIPPNHIGIFRKQKRPNQLPHFSWHELLETNEESLFISGAGVKARDSFRFYQLDPVAARKEIDEALSAVVTGSIEFDGDYKSVAGRCPRSTHSARKQVLGGLFFGSAGRGFDFFSESNVEIYAFQEKLPGISLAGMFCLAEFGPLAILPGTDDVDESNKGKAIVNFFSSMFVLFYAEAGSKLT